MSIASWARAGEDPPGMDAVYGRGNNPRTGRSSAIAQSLRPLPAGRGRGRILPAWMHSSVMGTTSEPGGLQQQTANGEESETGCLGQQGRRTIAGATDFTAGASTSTLPTIVPLPVGDVQQTPAPAWTRARTGGSALAGGGLRHQTPSGAQ